MSFLVSFLELLFPPRCLFCGCFPGEDPHGLSTCQACLMALSDRPARCGRCSRPVPPVYRCCLHCSGRRLNFEAACAVELFQGGLKKTIHHYKYRGKSRLSVPLGRLMARRVKESGWPEFSAVVPVPLHPAKVKERGFDQSMLLARTVSAELGVPLRPVLQRTRPTPSQTRLGAGMRWQNVEGAFRILPKEEVAGNVLLVDDLLTTGATAHHAAQPLLAAGASRVYLAVAAVAPGAS